MSYFSGLVFFEDERNVPLHTAAISLEGIENGCSSMYHQVKYQKGTGAMNWLPYSVARNALVLLILCLHTFVLATMPTGPKYTIHWNSSNPIFRIDNTDNVIDVNRNNLKFQYDQVNLICPVYTPETRDEEDMEKYIIYNVSKDEYETCRITNPNPRIIAVCDKPYKRIYFTITFRPFTSQAGGLEFLSGHDYYFISTSTSDDLHRRIGGCRSTHNMKIVFKVWAPPEDATTRATTSVSKPMWSSVTPSRTTESTTTTTSTEAPTTRATKKAKPYDKHPNEVVKSEELTLGGAHKNKVSLLVIISISLLLFATR